MATATIENGDLRRSLIREGISLIVAPFLSLFILGPVSQVFSRPNPWPVKGFIAIALLAGMVSGTLGLKRINHGRAGKYDRLGIIGLGLMLAGTLLYLLFLSLAMIVYGLSFYGLVPFGG